MTLSCEQQSDLESVVIAGFGSVGEIEMFQMQLWDRKMYERLESMSMSWWEPDQPFAFPAFNATTTTVAVDGFGNATMDHPDGLHYEGEWCESKPHGQGTLTWDDDGRYGGDWHEGKPHGRGSLTWPDGQQCYEGEWRKGKRHGQGTLKWVDDDGNNGRYEGEWRKGKRHGQGIFKCGGLPYGGGLHYDGDWRKGKPHGQGTFTWVDDEGNEGHYQGDWRKGRPHGQGVVTRPRRVLRGRVPQRAAARARRRYDAVRALRGRVLRGRAGLLSGGGRRGGGAQGGGVMDEVESPAHQQGSGRSVNEPTLSTGEIRALAGELAADLVTRGLSLADVERLAPLLVDRVRLAVPGVGARRREDGSV